MSKFQPHCISLTHNETFDSDYLGKADNKKVNIHDVYQPHPRTKQQKQ